MALKNKTEATEEMIKRVQKGSQKMTEPQALDMAGKLYGRGQFQQAERVCRQIIQHKPSLADAHNILGVVLNALGKRDEGIASLRKAIELSPRNANYHSNLGEILRMGGDLEEARKALEISLKLNPDNPQALNNLGIVHYENKEYEEATGLYRKALKFNPSFAEAYNNLGNALRLIDERDEARKAYQEALAIRETYPEAYNNLGTLLREERKVDQAEHAIRKAIQQKPNYIDAYNNLATLLHIEGQDVEALRQMTEALKIEPRNSKSLLLTARIQLKRGNHEAVEKACKMVLHDDADNAEARHVLAQLAHERDHFDAAVKLMERAVELSPENPELRNFYGVTLKSVGRLDEARDQLRKAIELEPNNYGSYSTLNDLVDFSEEKELYEKLQELMKDIDPETPERNIPLYYAYAKALDDNGKKAEALKYYISGGKMKREQLAYDEAESAKFFDDIKKAFPAKLFKNRPFAGNDIDRPVFIVGMPRSGSTLAEQIISAHPEVHGAGEVKHFSKAVHQLRDRFPSLSAYPAIMGEMDERQYALLADTYLKAISQGAGNCSRVTDKLLTNYFFCGLINILYPNAKIINTRRNPVDTCLSAFTKLFKDDMPHSYDLGELGQYYQRYAALMDHWQKVLPKGAMMTVQYEDVVADTEAKAREIIDFIGLEWDPACLEFHTSKRPVKTASVAQVRKPIYKTAVERWRKYGNGLKPLIDIVG
ncbi:tetratricopeptide repeat-containing sulfotransferase family protein [Alteraurantiacibacter aquimixticola]|uniref:Sulfotransferase family protein n=1 Tax=Alteraurantiacibacter aquimixticola TaxID=2489173 RepID=A0A4V4U8M8_9SPHN|nr:tetratricopeptide repeat-containing sulfotransferase family protein [Alteraurantiacibacter aquimixticola]TIX50693.1 sulfotransferase family protein [Alteraurantiacibacter aquimixticola]